MARRETDWQVGAVLKNKPNSQGTLFRGGTSQMSDARFPRGYTPERLHEVANVVGGSITRGQGAKSGTFRDHAYVHPATKEEAGRANNKPKRDLVDNIARSTVPVEDMTKADPGRRLHFWVHDSFDRRMEADNHAGTYFHEPPSHSNRHDIYLQTNAVRGDTPIHEIGHHVSHMTGEHPGYATPAQQGQEEAQADNYAEKHFRDRRGKQAYGGTYGGGQFLLNRPDDFWSSYHKHRDNSLYRAQVAADDEEHYRRYPEDRTHKDGSMDVPLIEKSFVSKDSNEKPEINLNWDALPDR